MAVPSFAQASAGTTDATGAWTHTSAGPFVAGNVLLVHLLQDGTSASPPTITSVTNAEDLAGTDNVLTYLNPSATSFPVGSAAAAYQHFWIGRALSTSAMVITGANAGGDDVYVRVYEFRNVNTGTTLADVIENATAGATVNSAGTSATAADASVQTLSVDRLVLNFTAVNDDNAISNFTGETGGDWEQLTAPYADSGGTDGAIAVSGAYPGIGFYGGNTLVGSIFGATGTAEMQAMSFDSGPGGNVSSLIVKLRKSGTPTDDVVVEIQTDSSGVPSGTAVGTSDSISGADLTLNITPVAFAVSATLAASTTYWIVISRSGARDAVNFFHAGGTAGDAYAGGTLAERASGTWTTVGNDLFFNVQYGTTGGTIDGGTGSVVDIDAWGVVGFALIGTTPPPVTEAVPRNPAINHQNPAILAKKWERARSGVWLPPKLWTPRRPSIMF